MRSAPVVIAGCQVVMLLLYGCGSSQNSIVVSGPKERLDRTVGEIAMDWRKATTAQRRELLTEVLGQQWIQKRSLIVVPLPEKSIVWGKTRDEVTDLLGPPDRETRVTVSYKLGYLRERTWGQRTEDLIGPGPGEDALVIYFNDESGKVARVAVQH